MSARYVWGRYTIRTEYTEYDSGTTIRYSIASYSKIWIAAGGRKIDQETGLYEPQSPTRECVSPNSSVTSTYPVVFVQRYNVDEIDYSTALVDESPSNKRSFSIRRDNTIRIWDERDSEDVECHIYKIRANSISGDFVDNVISGSASAYPSNGSSNGYWYVYQGQDSIDPVSIEALVTNWFYIGQQVVLAASPSVSKIYGGTVSYQYQVQINGGSWTNIGNKTTATSVNYTIPEGTVSIAFRVQASDDLGFTSADWIQSETYTVSKYEPGIKHRVHRKNESGEYDITHFETDTSCVLMSDGTSLEDQLVNIISEIERRGG